jgi:Fe-S-cluster containining protein
MTCVSTGKKLLRGAVPPAVPPEAGFLLRLMEERLILLDQLANSSPLAKEFRSLYSEVTALAGRYQEMVIGHSEYSLSCRKGCAGCCCHWVEDVNSFEAEIIADHIRVTMPERVQTIRRQCAEDMRELERLEGFVQSRLSEEAGAEREKIDPIDLLLSVFYRMRRPCPLLDGEGGCMVYDIRPFTCRIYVSFSDPVRCNPEYISSKLAPTCIIDFSEEVNSILDRLHFRYLRFPGDTGLRSQLLKYLT